MRLKLHRRRRNVIEISRQTSKIKFMAETKFPLGKDGMQTPKPSGEVRAVSIGRCIFAVLGILLLWSGILSELVPRESNRSTLVITLGVLMHFTGAFVFALMSSSELDKLRAKDKYLECWAYVACAAGCGYGDVMPFFAFNYWLGLSLIRTTVLALGFCNWDVLFCVMIPCWVHLVGAIPLECILLIIFCLLVAFYHHLQHCHPNIQTPDSLTLQHKLTTKENIEWYIVFGGLSVVLTCSSALPELLPMLDNYTKGKFIFSLIAGFIMSCMDAALLFTMIKDVHKHVPYKAEILRRGKCCYCCLLVFTSIIMGTMSDYSFKSQICCLQVGLNMYLGTFLSLLLDVSDFGFRKAMIVWGIVPGLVYSLLCIEYQGFVILVFLAALGLYHHEIAPRLYGTPSLFDGL